MKLPQCQYPTATACGACAAPIKNTFNMLWKAMDGNLDMDNLDLDTFGEGIEIVKKPAPGGGTKKKATVPIGDETTKCYWQKKAPPDTGGPGPWFDEAPGMELHVDASHSSGLGKMCVVDKRDRDKKQVVSINIDPAEGVAAPNGGMSANYGNLELDAVGDVLIKGEVPWTPDNDEDFRPLTFAGIKFTNGNLSRTMVAGTSDTANNLADILYTVAYDMSKNGELSGYTMTGFSTTNGYPAGSYVLNDLFATVATVISELQTNGFFKGGDYSITARRLRFMLNCDSFTIDQLSYVATTLLRGLGV